MSKTKTAETPDKAANDSFPAHSERIRALVARINEQDRTMFGKQTRGQLTDRDGRRLKACIYYLAKAAVSIESTK
jgi:hypothetical protein